MVVSTDGIFPQKSYESCKFESSSSVSISQVSGRDQIPANLQSGEAASIRGKKDAGGVALSQERMLACGPPDNERCRMCRGQWLDKQRAGLSRYIRRKVSNVSDVEDLVQETILTIYQFFIKNDICIKFGQYRPEFAFRKAGHVLIDYFRKRKVRCYNAHLAWSDEEAGTWSESFLSDAPGPEELCQLRETLINVLSEMGVQGARTHQIFALRFIGECSLKEIAKREALSLSCVEKHLARARKVFQ